MPIRFIDPNTKLKVEVDTVEEYEKIIKLKRPKKNNTRHNKNYVNFMKSIGITTLDGCERPVLCGESIEFRALDINNAIQQRIEFQKWKEQFRDDYSYLHRSNIINNIPSNIMEIVRCNIKKYGVNIIEE